MFNVFETNTTAFANKLMDNFYYLGGDRMPYSTTALGSLTAVDNTYDLGSVANRWDDVYVDTLYVTNDIESLSNTLWVLEYEDTLVSNTASFTVSGLSGDSGEVFKIILKTVSNGSDTGFINLYFNAGGDSYTNRTRVGDGSTVTSASVTYSSSFVSIIGVTGTCYNESIIYAQSGQGKTIISSGGNVMTSAGVDSVYKYVTFCDSVATMTSMTFVNPFGAAKVMGVGTSIQIWSRG